MSGATFRLDPTATAKVIAAAESALADAAEFLAEEANKTAPIEEGTLIRSAHVTVDGLDAAVSYDTPYARRQHEDTRLRHDAGRRAKWLQRTLDEKSSRVTTFIADRMRAVLP